MAGIMYIYQYLWVGGAVVWECFGGGRGRNSGRGV